LPVEQEHKIMLVHFREWVFKRAERPDHRKYVFQFIILKKYPNLKIDNSPIFYKESSNAS
jgi:alpha-amylase/alpha-mannosidase (GH57 family)